MANVRHADLIIINCINRAYAKIFAQLEEIHFFHPAAAICKIVRMFRTSALFLEAFVGISPFEDPDAPHICVVFHLSAF
jgi:hypothetical protein